MIKKTLAAAAAALMLSSLASCSDDNGMDSALDLYQEYEVLITRTSRAAFANFRLGSATGERVKLTNGTTATCNMLTMWYTEPISPTEPEFSYAATLDMNHTKAVFRFNRNNEQSLVNEISFDEVKPVTIPADLEDIPASGEIHLEFPVQEGPVSYRAVLVKDNSARDEFNGLVDPARSSATFVGLEPGNYSLTVDAYKTVPTTANDGGAKGSITLIQRSTRNRVTLPSAASAE